MAGQDHQAKGFWMRIPRTMRSLLRTMRFHALAVALGALVAIAPSYGPRSGHVYVHGYTRSDGSYVAPYYRSLPHRSWWNAESSPSPEESDAGGASIRPHTRSKAARNEYVREHPCPSTGRTSGACPGWVVDHVQALKHGGADAPWNMQWQTIEDAKEKDRWE